MGDDDEKERGAAGRHRNLLSLSRDSRLLLSPFSLNNATLASLAPAVAPVPLHGCLRGKSLDDPPFVVTSPLLCATLPTSAAYVALQVPVPSLIVYLQVINAALIA